jgi:predicted nucleotidyltransferase
MPTALELSPEEWKRYRRGGLDRSYHEMKDVFQSAEKESILLRVRKVASGLKTRFGAQRVILFGSLAHDEWFMPDSDVDLAVEGLSGENYWAAWGLAEEIIGDRPVDLIEMETATESMRKAIERYGVEM